MGKKNPAIIAAALNPRMGSTGAVEKMLNRQNINSLSRIDELLPKNSSLLHIAVAQQNEEQVALLIERKIDVNIQNSKRETALMLALKRGATESMIETLATVPSAEMELQNLHGQTPLVVACTSNNTEAVRCLLEQKADPNTQDPNGDTSLHLSLRLRLNDVVEVLLKDQRTNIAAVNAKGKTPPMLIKPDQRHLSELLQAAVKPQHLGQGKPHNSILGFVLKMILLLLSCSLAMIQELPSMVGYFESATSFFMLPIFVSVLLISFFA